MTANQSNSFVPNISTPWTRDVWRSGQMYVQAPGSSPTGAQQPLDASNQLHAGAWWTGRKGVTIDEVSVRVWTANAGGSIARLCIYRPLNSNLYEPGDLLIDAGTVGIDSTGNKTISISNTFLPPPLVFWCVYADDISGQWLTYPPNIPGMAFLGTGANTDQGFTMWKSSTSTFDPADPAPDPFPTKAGTPATQHTIAFRIRAV